MPAIVHGGEQVISNRDLRDGQRGGGNVYHIDARGEQRGVSTEIMRAIRMGDQQAVINSVNAVQNSRQRGGSFARTFGG